MTIVMFKWTMFNMSFCCALQEKVNQSCQRKLRGPQQCRHIAIGGRLKRQLPLELIFCHVCYDFASISPFFRGGHTSCGPTRLEKSHFQQSWRYFGAKHVCSCACTYMCTCANQLHSCASVFIFRLPPPS